MPWPGRCTIRRSWPQLAGGGAPPRPLPPGLQAAVERVAANDYAGALAALDAVPEAARDARYYTYRAGVLLNVGRVDEAGGGDRSGRWRSTPRPASALAQRAIIQVVQNRKRGGARRCAARGRAEPGLRRRRGSPCPTPCRRTSSSRKRARGAARGGRAQPGGRARLGAACRARADVRRAGRRRDAAERAVALAPELARTQMVLGFAALTRIDIDQAKAAFERAIALDFGQPARRASAWASPSSAAATSSAGGREIEIAAALDPNDSLLRSYLGKAYFEEKRDPLGRRAVRDRQGARSERPDALVLRRDPPADREPPGRGAARPREIDRAERQPRRLPLAPAARRGPRGPRRQPRADLRRSRLRAAGRQRGGAVARARSGQLGRAPLPLRPLCRQAAARGGAGQRAAPGAAAAAGRPQPGPAQPRVHRSQCRCPQRPGAGRLQRVHAAVHAQWGAGERRRVLRAPTAPSATRSLSPVSTGVPRSASASSTSRRTGSARTTISSTTSTRCSASPT